MSAEILDYVVGQATWSADELSILERGLETYLPSQFSSINRYLMMSVNLPGKSIRDIAHRVRSVSLEDGDAPLTMFKRARVENVRARNAAKLSSEPDFSSTENRTVNTLAAAPPSTDSIEQRILRSRDSVIDDRINELLMANINTMSCMRDNLLALRLADNITLMAAFRNNVNAVLELLPTSMPPLPIQLNTAFLGPEGFTVPLAETSLPTPSIKTFAADSLSVATTPVPMVPETVSGCVEKDGATKCQARAADESAVRVVVQSPTQRRTGARGHGGTTSGSDGLPAESKPSNCRSSVSQDATSLQILSPVPSRSTTSTGGVTVTPASHGRSTRRNNAATLQV